MKIIYVLKSTGLCGGHRVVMEHCNRLVDLGHDVELYGIDRSWEAWFPLKAKFIQYTNWEELELRLQREKGIKVATWWETAEHVIKSKNKNDRLVYFVQEIETGYTNSIEEERKVVETYNMHFDAFITTSEHNLKGLKEFGINGHKIGIGYDNSVYRVTKSIKSIDKEKSILSMYRQNPLKGFNLFADAAKLSLQKIQDLKINLFGMQIVQNSIDFPFIYHFGLSDFGVAELYNTIPIYVNTSTNEGFGLPMLEAMACGAVVVCTNSGGNMDFCENEVNCLMIDNRDPQALAECIIRLFEDDMLYKRLQNNAIETVKQFTWDKSINKLNEVYGKL